jgi:uncharacterized protein (DUF305 family)
MLGPTREGYHFRSRRPMCFVENRFSTVYESRTIPCIEKVRMSRQFAQTIAAALMCIIVNVACSHRVVLSHVARVEGDNKSIHQPTAEQRLLGIYQPYSDADINFMTGMIPHHAQAVIMAGWAPSHGARSDVAILCERIVVGQKDEIQSMQSWLGDRGLPVPDAKSTRMRMKMNGVEHDMLMPGMLTDEEMTELDKARGPEFDRLFLLGMIKHHQGAIDMVDDLFKAYGAAQDDTIYKFASDVFADQSIEIEVMQRMLNSHR